MKIVVGIAHPKQVYMFKNLIKSFQDNHHEVLVLVVDKEVSCKLLDVFGIEYVKIGVNKKKYLQKIFAIIPLTIKTFIKSFFFKPDLYIGQALPHFALNSFFFQKPFILLEDTEIAKSLYNQVMKFVSSVITNSNFLDDFKDKHIRVDANLECAYLHPNVYKPDKEIFRYLEIAEGERYVFLRFVSWSAFHDKGHRGLSLDAKIKAVEEFSKYTKVFISSEYELEDIFKKYEVNIPVNLFHSLEYYADLVFGESPTITTESAMLGTPSLCISSWAHGNLGNFKELSKCDMSHSFHPNDEYLAIDKGIEILKGKLKITYKGRSLKFMEEHINLSAFLYWFILNYPQSHQIVIEDPNYQDRFKQILH